MYLDKELWTAFIDPMIPFIIDTFSKNFLGENGESIFDNVFSKYTKKEYIELSYRDVFTTDYRYKSIIKSKLIKCICDTRKIYLLADGRQQERRIYSTILQLKEDEKVANALIKLIEEN